MSNFFNQKNRFVLIILAFILSLSVTAQVNPDDKLPLDAKVKIGKLDNGLTYYIRENKKPEQHVELRLVLNAGSINEDDDQLGLAHMAEHMAFNGTTHFKKNDIVSFLQDIGVGFGSDLNAQTSFDETIYILPIPTDKPGNLEKGFQVLEDWAHNVTYLTDDIEGERAIILEESRRGKGANDRMFQKYFPKVFENSRYAVRLPIGKDSLIKNFPPDAIRRFYKDWYRPDLMAVVVVGDITTAQVEELIKKHFASIQNPANERQREVPPVYPYKESSAMVLTDKEATSNTVTVIYPAEKSNGSVTIKGYRNDLINQIFSTVLNLRLQELTQKPNPPFLGAGAGFNGLVRGYKSFIMNVGAGNNDPVKALSAAAQEVERIKKFGVTNGELERVKKIMQASYERAYNDRDKNESENYTNEYVNHFLEQEPSPGIEKEFEYVKAILPNVTVDDVNALANKLKAQQNYFAILTGPERKAGEKLPTEAELKETIAAAQNADLKPYEEKTVAASLLKTIPKSGKVISKTENKTAGTTELKLSNGVNVTLKSTDFKNDQVLMGANRAGGKNNYSLKDKYNAEYAIQVVSSMGIGDFSPTDLKKALAGKTAAVSTQFGYTYEGLKGNSSVKDMETMFQLIYLNMTNPRMDTALAKAFIQRNKSQYAMLAANPQAVFVDTLYKTYYNNNKLAPLFVPNSAYFDKINVKRAVEIYKERFSNAQGMNFVFVGSFNNETIIPLIEKYIASLPSAPAKFAYVDNKVRPVTGNKKLVINKGKEQKSLIVQIFNGAIPYSDDMDLKAQAVTGVLNIRVVEELREKIQGIYSGGISGGLQKVPYSHFEFIAQLPCGPEKVDTLLKAMRNEINAIIKNGPSEDNLKKVKLQSIEEHKKAIEENEEWLDVLLDNKFPGSDINYFLKYEDYVNKLTVKDVQKAAALMLGEKNSFTGVLMPEQKK
ncbi:MAG: insulinase family protein [Sphingobacteriales bacterium]|nr:insulinase family protein [Sphingobacteriales bacterium]